MTDNYYVIIETPFIVDVLKILTSKYLRIPFFHCLKYYENYPVSWHRNDHEPGGCFITLGELSKPVFLRL